MHWGVDFAQSLCGKHLKLNQYIEVLNGKTVEGVSKESSDLIKRDLQELIEYGKSDEELKAEDKGDIITLKQYLSTREKANGGFSSNIRYRRWSCYKYC